MKQLGRIHWLVLVGIVGIVGLFVILMLGGATPNMVAGDFMTALAKGNVDQLVETTYIGSDNRGRLRKEWEFTTKVAGPHYRFTWKILGYSQQGPNNASVKIEIVRNALNNGSYPEHFDLPLLKEDGRWKVRATGLSREIFPGLPR